MEVILNIIIFILVLFVIIVIHELGHFMFAKRAGILVHEFSFGMGPSLFQTKKGTTKYSIRAIPLGGYVAMSGENGQDDSFITKGQKIGLNFDELGIVNEIIMDQTISNPTIIGNVVSSDLYGKDFTPLYIEIQTEDEVKRYEVRRDAKYLFKKKQSLSITPSESSFSSKTIWQRFLVLFAGPGMNFLLTLFLLLMIAIIQGKPQDVAIVGASQSSVLEQGDVINEVNGIEVDSFNEVISIINSNSFNQASVIITFTRNGNTITEEVPLSVVLQNFGFTNVYNDNKVLIGNIAGKAQQAGLRTGDEIVYFKLTEGDVDYIFINPTWNQLIQLSRSVNTGTIEIHVLRDSSDRFEFTYSVIDRQILESLDQSTTVLQLGIGRTYQFDFLYTITSPFTNFYSNIKQMVVTLGLLFNPTVDVGVSDLAGPLGIFSIVSNAAASGFISILSITAFLSVNIGLMNLLPIPALDGGRLLFLGYEAVSKKKIPTKVEALINNIAFVLLMALFIFVTWNDILRLFS